MDVQDTMEGDRLVRRFLDTINIEIATVLHHVSHMNIARVEDKQKKLARMY